MTSPRVRVEVAGATPDHPNMLALAAMTRVFIDDVEWAASITSLEASVKGGLVSLTMEFLPGSFNLSGPAGMLRPVLPVDAFSDDNLERLVTEANAELAKRITARHQEPTVDG